MDDRDLPLRPDVLDFDRGCCLLTLAWLGVLSAIGYALVRWLA